ncbi:MAG: hypothetical protein FH762_04925 [Firmicutes bacterium]|nr:hypothetical protein [Bacillota bacterium]
MAEKLKVKLKINRYYIPFPAIPLGLIGSSLRFINKHFAHHLSKGGSQRVNPQEIDRLIAVLKNEEPFELVHVETEDQDEHVFIRIYTK